tara:strand:+ start:285 stop:671 length:387 start_codon:yes stop_codon:yes gene_type:complete
MSISKEEFELYRLKYVLAIYLVQQVVLADEKTTEEELDFIKEHFPKELLQSLNLLDEKEMSVLLEKALKVLPGKLSLQGKLDIIGMCFGASASDGDVDIREVATIQVAAEILNVPSDILFDFIQKLLD